MNSKRIVMMPTTPDKRLLESLYRRRAILENLIQLLNQYAPQAEKGAPLPQAPPEILRLAQAEDSAPVLPEMAALQPSRVLVVSSEPVMCEGFRSLLSSTGMRLVASCGSVPQALEQLHSIQPDIAILHLNSPCFLDQIPAILKRAPQCAIAVWADRISMEMVGRAVKFGVRGIFPTNLAPGMFLESLLAISRGDIRVNLPAKICSPTHQDTRLSKGQRNLVALIGQGLKNKEIATALGSTEGTVKTSLNRLFKALGAKDRFDVALYAMQTQAIAEDTMDSLPEGCEVIDYSPVTRASAQ
jgi:two-component system, NarL family, nitrate/nitrite response regulator NarL